MQFIQNGPNVPDQLLQAHEEGKVIFFCGAGISYPADLPGFGGLVQETYRALGTPMRAQEQDVFDRYRYDATLDLLEHRVGRAEVRRALTGVLKPKLRKKGAVSTHEALLELAKCSSGQLRLVTTNFDRIFEHVISKKKLQVTTHAAPLLPIPKNSKWDGLVYLHGLLEKNPTDSSLNRLVVTSGDFGLAYLTERWAARFVSELFRNYVVCFVGYSIDDPVMRYMMDAMAADRMLGESAPTAYAFGSAMAGEETKKEVEWKAKGVAPILYLTPTALDHSALHGTLSAWAGTYKDGVSGKEQIVVNHALALPSLSTQQDDYVGRLLWAFSDRSAVPAAKFADFDPAPSLEWFDAFKQERYFHQDLNRFGVPAHAENDRKLKFSLARRPSSYTGSPWMSIFSDGSRTRWDAVMHQLARWLVRHLNDSALVVWACEQAGSMHPSFVQWAERSLDEIARLEADGRDDLLRQLMDRSPSAVPVGPIRTAWRLLLAGRCVTPGRNLRLHWWGRRLASQGISTVLRFELRELLTPKVEVKRAISSTGEGGGNEIEFEVTLDTDGAHDAMRELSKDVNWQASRASMIDDFVGLLLDALRLMKDVEQAGDDWDRSTWDQPSIAEHGQNRGFREWTVLIELVRDSWIDVARDSPQRAHLYATKWFTEDFLTFKRLALFAATFGTVVPDAEWIEWLRADHATWLWRTDTKREVCRLLAERSGNLGNADLRSVEGLVLRGPRREDYADMADDAWCGVRDRAVWVRLVKLSEGRQLSAEAAAELVRLTDEYPYLVVSPNQQEEFSSWFGASDDSDFQSRRTFEHAPRYRSALIVWLRNPVPDTFWYEDDWSKVCEERFNHAAMALRDLAMHDIWPVERWRTALQVWSHEGIAKRSWTLLSPVVVGMPANVVEELAHALSWWLRPVASHTSSEDQHFLQLAGMLLAVEYQMPDEVGDPVSMAINHPVGLVADALLNHLFREIPADGSGIPARLVGLFNAITDPESPKYLPARVVLASRAIALFRTDEAWAQERLLPRFDWGLSESEARGAWCGFMRSPRAYRPVLAAVKRDFLLVAHHYESLGGFARIYAQFLTFVAIDPGDLFSAAELTDVFEALPTRGLSEVATALANGMEGAGDGREPFWLNRVEPFLRKIWPKGVACRTASTSDQLGRLAVRAGQLFPAVMEVVGAWLVEVKHPDYLIHLLLGSGHCSAFPEKALELLSKVVTNNVSLPSDLGACLDAIADVRAQLANDQRYRALRDLWRQRH